MKTEKRFRGGNPDLRGLIDDRFKEPDIFEIEQKNKKRMDAIMEKAEKHRWNIHNFPNSEYGRSLQPFAEWPKEALLSFLDCCLYNCPAIMKELAHMDAEIKAGN
jgi:hypothetical protein